MGEEPSWKELVERLQATFKEDGKADSAELGLILRDRQAVDIALALEDLDPDIAQKIFAALDEHSAVDVLERLGPELRKRCADILPADKLDRAVNRMPKREAAALLAEKPAKAIEKDQESGAVTAAVAADAEQRSAYPENSVGRIMTTEFVRLRADMTAADALQEVRRSDPTNDIPDDLCVVESKENVQPKREKLLGVISIRDVVMAEADNLIGEIMARDVVCVRAKMESTAAARLLSKHKFLALPVTDDEGFLIGLMPADDLMQITVARLHDRYSKAVGTDAAAMEQMTSLQAAKKRVPWLLGTMVIELGAAVVVSHFSAILEKVILLASFMPVISAVSGNVGLQAAAITVRSLDEGQTSLKEGGKALFKEIVTTIFMAVVCGAVLGIIGGFWSRHWMFGAVIGVALTCSMITAAFMGTLFPMVSKKLGFDPATTAGPFETAFQDVIGFGVFLGLATLLTNHI